MKTGLILFINSLFLTTWVGAAALPDPTRPYQYNTAVEIDYSVEEDRDWRLSGIRFEQVERFAIINNKLVREGDKVDGAEVLEIKPDNVVLSYDNKHLELKLHLTGIKKPVTVSNSQ